MCDGLARMFLDAVSRQQTEMVFVLLSNGRAVAVLSQHASGNSIAQSEGSGSCYCWRRVSIIGVRRNAEVNVADPLRPPRYL